MTRAQAAWVYFSALFLVAAVVLRLVDPESTLYALVAFIIATLGWVIIGCMILADRKPIGE